jgi:hypothetical protein
VEIFFNFLWVSVTIALGAVWFGTPRRAAKSQLPALGVQLTALVVLALILLPVISLTDDLQASITLAETEHIARRGDTQPLPNQRLHLLPVALNVLAIPRIPTMMVRESIVAEQPPLLRMHAFSRALATRPPPAAIHPA